ncbi:MAG: sigma factor-like helix-turn-helix DNA-binding protein [Parcubacteria group bacterium]
MNKNYAKICSNLLSNLPPRAKSVVLRRFGLETGERETLEAVGDSFGITRERVRQIEEGGLEKIRPEIKNYQDVFQSFSDYFKKHGGLKREINLLKDLGGTKQSAQVYFLLSLNNNFIRLGESEDFYPLWLIDKNCLNLAQKTISTLFNKLKEIKRPLQFKELKAFQPVDEASLISYLEISKKIQKNSENLFGLKDWPEINPKGVKDKAYLAFKKTGKPLHFTEVTRQINGALVQTVHNELIRDSRFVLVGRGIYALSEWGYAPGQVKDVISTVLKESKKPLTKEEVLNQVLKQRMVKENTILLNLSNKDYFLRNNQGKYTVREI